MSKKKTNVALIGTGVLFLVGLVLLLVVLLSPVSKIGTYKNTQEIAGKEVVTEIKFDKDTYTTTMKDEKLGETEYEIKDGKLYLKGSPIDSGEINSRKIVTKAFDQEIVYKNGLASALFIVSIVLTAVGALGAAAVVITKKK